MYITDILFTLAIFITVYMTFIIVKDGLSSDKKVTNAKLAAWSAGFVAIITHGIGLW